MEFLENSQATGCLEARAANCEEVDRNQILDWKDVARQLEDIYRQ